MKNRLLQHIFRKIKGNYKRFISLLCMSFLGVGFFAGIKSVGPDMIKTLDEFYDTHEVYDIEVVSTLGLTDKDIIELEKIDNIDRVVGTFYKDVYLDIENQEFNLRLMAINNNMNKPYLESGHLPKNNNEIIVEKSILEDNNLKIGDFITLENKEYKIVGTVISPIYFSNEKPTTTIGNGKINYYAYVLEDVVKQDVFTNIYITVKGAKEEVTNSDNYVEKIDNVISNIESINQNREEARYDELYGEVIKNAQQYGVQIDESKFLKPTWFVWDRFENSSYDELISASDNLNKLGDVFPLIFFAIAILVSLISMMRMVEEDRTENGTLKSLGFNNFHITVKYIVYSLLATIIGGIVGMIVGSILIPNIIWNIYTELFYIPKFIYEFNSISGLIGLLICTLCITGTAIFVSIKNLKNVPATLMRPKVPKGGKKILLEKIPFIWNHLNFSNKITVRNIFRYRSRVLTTILGISGCTALILAGFGLKDSLKDITDYQFEEIMKYDKIITLKSDKGKDKIIEELNNNEFVSDIVEAYINTMKVKNNNEKQEVTLIVANNNDELKKVIFLEDITDKNNKDLVPSDNKVIISEKTSKLLNLNVGDDLILLDEDNNEHSLEIEYITRNYINQYIYLNKVTYENIFKKYKTNSFMLNLKEMNKLENDNFNENFINKDEVASVISNSDIEANVKEILGSIDSIVIILIVAAALLAFVVLYNLSNINISERKREIATLKVLGFYHKEVDRYITRENIILTIIGISIGLFFGSYLSHFIISTCEPDYIMFIRHVDIISYLLSALITIIFTIIVNIITHYNLKKIDMIESLKNVE